VEPLSLPANIAQVTDSDKRARLLRHENNYGHKKFCRTDVNGNPFFIVVDFVPVVANLGPLMLVIYGRRK